MNLFSSSKFFLHWTSKLCSLFQIRLSESKALMKRNGCVMRPSLTIGFLLKFSRRSVSARSPSDPMALPGSPSQPRLLHRTSNSLTIGWQSGSRMGASALLGYTVEYFSSSEDDIVDETQVSYSFFPLVSTRFFLVNLSQPFTFFLLRLE